MLYFICYIRVYISAWEDKHKKKVFFFSGRTTKRGGGRKTTSTTKKKLFMHDLNKMTRIFMKHKKNNKKKCMLCSVLVNIVQQKKVIKVSENIIF